MCERNVPSDALSPDELRSDALCVQNVTYGCVIADGKPQQWIAGRCAGVFQCDNMAAHIRCITKPGRIRGGGRGGRKGARWQHSGDGKMAKPISVCPCNEFNTIEANAHRHGGKIYPIVYDGFLDRSESLHP